tara:strand:- start:607 stop:786 length:180 start_codon:yes stop_codon:yes gene_type:complete
MCGGCPEVCSLTALIHSFPPTKTLTDALTVVLEEPKLILPQEIRRKEKKDERKKMKGKR